MMLGDVEYAEPDRILRHTATPNDPQYTNQWHYKDTWGINAPGAWDITTGSSDVVVAVIDTGITNHVDLSGRTLPGYDFISDAFVANDGNVRDGDPSDPGDWITASESASGYFQGCQVTNSSWHGTHVAGTMGQRPITAQASPALTGFPKSCRCASWASVVVMTRTSLMECGGRPGYLSRACRRIPTQPRC